MISPPMNEAICSEYMPSNAVSGASVVVPSTMIPTAPSPAPADTPTNPGSASGLRNKPCIRRPDTAKAAPIKTPSNMRGRRIL